MKYALKSSTMPIGVATYHLSSELPENYKTLGRVDVSNEMALLLKNGTIKEENAVNGAPLHKFSDAECAIFKHNPTGQGRFLPILR